MRYNIIIRQQAKKKLQNLDKKTRTRIAQKIHQLGENPNNQQLDIKPLEGNLPYWRLRIGSWRIIYLKDDQLKIIAVKKIKPRGNAYK